MSDKQKSHQSTIHSPSIPPGYKQTEVGVIPEDWEVKHLKKISPVQSVGLVINPSSYFDDKGTVPILVGSNISENNINWESAKRISDASNKLIPSSQLTAGDIVTVRVGEPGTTAVVPPELNGCNCASMMIVRKHESFDSAWLSYMMNSRVGLKQVEHVQYGTAQKQFNISDAIHFRYPVPSLTEQKAIAKALSDADDFIESLEQLIAKKRHIKQGAMQELLTGKKRLPGFSGEWTDKPFSEICWFQEGPGVRDYQFTTSGIKLLNGTNIFRGELNLDSTSRFISEKEAYSAGMNILLERQAPAWHWECQAPAWRIWNAKQQLRDSGVVVLAKLELGDPAWRSGLARR